MFLTLLAAVGGGVALYYFIKREQERLDEAWSWVASELRLHSASEGRFTGRRLAGEVEGARVEVAEVQRGSGKSRRTFTRVLVYGDRNVSSELRIRPETGWTGVKKLFTGADVEVADEEFDREVHVEGDAARVSAALDAKCRKRLLWLCRSFDFELRDGVLHVDSPGRLKDPEQMVQAARVLLKVARGLSVGRKEVPAALARNAEHDPLADVRLMNLTRLMHQTDSQRAAEAGRAVLNDPSARVRSLGALLAKGEEGRWTLEQIAFDVDAPPVERALAISRLEEGWPYGEISELISRLLEERRPEVVAAAAGVAARARDTDQVLPLCAAVTRNPALVGPVATALGQLEDVRAQPTLLTLLDIERRGDRRRWWPGRSARSVTWRRWSRCWR